MTVKIALTKLSNLFKFIILLLIIFIIRLKKNEILPGTLLIIRLDVIGDYVLFRNFLEVVRKSERFGKYNITLCGNIIWRDLAEELDSDFVDTFIWIDRRKFSNNFFYKYKILKSIYTKGFGTAVDTTYSREILFGDSIIRASNAKLRIGSSGALDKHAKWKRNLLTDKYYTKLINTTKDNVFEFYRNKEFFEKLLVEEISLLKPSITAELNKSALHLTNKYIVIFHGSRQKNKIWSYKNFIDVIKFILENFLSDIVIVGSEMESDIANNIVWNINDTRIRNLTGQTKLSSLPSIIRSAELLITNESLAVHLAACVDTKFICVSNGERFGRFHPYPPKIFDKGRYIYPPEIMVNSDQPAMLSEKFRYSSDLDIQSVHPSEVIKLITELMRK